jgi:hypothetical protein
MRFLIPLVWLAGPALAQGAEETAYVIAMFTEQAQPLSFAEQVEVCGFVGFGPDGALTHSAPELGDYASCPLSWPDGMRMLASYHTHGIHDADYENELPSIQDLEGDMARGVQGWVATPGGRLWYVDAGRGQIVLMCPTGCLPVYPTYRPEDHGPIGKVYSLDALTRRLGG